MVLLSKCYSKLIYRDFYDSNFPSFFYLVRGTLAAATDKTKQTSYSRDENLSDSEFKFLYFSFVVDF